ncbi:MAG: hypothetical protein HS126_40100 [Anaerolineales bacterium]|nr:hypothetical protein [Anaerolineales bacterium]
MDTEARRVIEALAVFKRPVLPGVDYLLEPFAPGLDVPGILRRLTRTNIVIGMTGLIRWSRCIRLTKIMPITNYLRRA